MPDNAKENGKIEVVVDTSYFTTMERYTEWEETVGERKVRPYMTFLCEHKIIKSWSLDGNPQDVERLLALSPQQWKKVNEQVVGKINGLFQD